MPIKQGAENSLRIGGIWQNW